MNKMIKVGPRLARIIKSFGKAQNNAGRAQASQLTANGTKIVIRNPELLRIIRYFRKASNQVKSSPLSLRSADNANYSEVQDLKGRIAKLINEKECLKGQYDQQKEQDKAFYDNLLAQHNNLNIQYGNSQAQINLLQNYGNLLQNQVNNLQNQVNNLQNQNGAFQNYYDAARNLRDLILRWVDPNMNPGNFANGALTPAALNALINGVTNNL